MENSQYEINRLKALYDLNILDTPYSVNFDRITSIAQIILEVPICVISLVDINRQWFKSCKGLSAKETPRCVSFCSHAILQDSIFEIPDARMDDRFKNNSLVTGYPYIRFYAGRPINGTTDYRIGTLCIIDSKPRKLSMSDKKILNDLAEWVENEFHIIQVDKKLKEDINSKKELVAMMSHELKNTLSPILGFSEILQNSINSKEEQKQYLSIIQDSSLKLSNQINDIMDIFKMDLKSFLIQKQPTSIQQIITNTLSKLQMVLLDKKIVLKTDIQYKNEIICDKNRIEQVLYNLIINSVDYVDYETGVINLTVNLHNNLEDEFIVYPGHPFEKICSKNNLLFSIFDNGSGIPDNKIDELFTKFTKSVNKKDRKYGGSGLGLAICKGIIETHEGKIWYDKSYKKGACFHFTLPLQNKK